jgi:hypothetical protein
MLTIFAKDVFGMDATGLGFLMPVSGVGGLVASLGVASLVGNRGKGLLLVGLCLAMSLAEIGFAVSPSLPLSLLLLAVLSGTSMACLSLTQSLMLLIVPNAYRGRVMSVFMLDRGMMPLGAMVAGFLAALWGGPAALATLGVAALLFSGLVLVLFPNVRRLD